MTNRLAYLDVLRLLAVSLVMFAHFVLVAGGATKITGIINSDFPLPLIDHSAWQLWKIEVFVVDKFSSQTGTLGVTLFFLVTGYLIPMMLERHTRRSFLVNRFFRIFPALFVAMIMLGVFVGATQGISFTLSSYLASWTLTYHVFGVAPVAGVLWTLVIEVLFYLCACILGKFSMHKLFLLQAVMLTILLVSVRFPNIFYLVLAARQAKYLLMIAVGSAIYLAEKETDWHRKILFVSGAIFVSYFGSQLYKLVHEDTSTYNNPNTYFLGLGLFLFFQWAAKLSSAIFNKLPNVFFLLADLVYPIYLLHATIGLGTMALMRSVTSEPYLLLLAAITASILLSWLLHKFIEVPGISQGRLLVKRLEARG